MANPFVHVELHTRDAESAREFYSRLFGWKLVDQPMPGGEPPYTMVQVGEGTGGGICQDTSAAPAWLAYVGVEDIAVATARARELGAQILVDCLAVGDFGFMTVFLDPLGAKLAMWQAVKKP
jgi:predicted enzyme related to lactoylglutathione lyase